MTSASSPSIAQLAIELGTGQITATALLDQCLCTIARRDHELNAFITVMEEAARADAHRADTELAAGRSRSLLHGIPISVKDLIDLRGLPTTAASRVRAGHLAASDAPVLARLREAGAIFIGKCNLHEFAFGTTGEDSAFGPTRNPYMPDRIAGGSSSGSAVSVAARMALASVGSDTGGSIRIPAAACGVVGLKPTFGELNCSGMVPLARTLDHVGPLASTVEDVALVYAVMTGDMHPPECRSRTRELKGNAQPHLGIPRRYFFDALDTQILKAFELMLERLRAAGCVVEDVDIPHAADTAPIYIHTVLAEAAALHAPTLETQAADYGADVRLRLEMGRYVLAEDYARAQAGRQVLRREVDAALSGRQALLLPTLPMPPPTLGTKVVTVGDVTDSVRALTLRLTQLFDLTGHPALSVPCGMTDVGLPVAAQFVGAHGHTHDLLQLAASYEAVIRA